MERSIAVAGRMCAVYPWASPGGWHLIGRSPVPLWDTRAGGRTLLAPGDQVEFAPVSVREYEAELARIADGDWSLAPCDDDLESAA